MLARQYALLRLIGSSSSVTFNASAFHGYRDCLFYRLSLPSATVMDCVYSASSGETRERITRYVFYRKRMLTDLYSIYYRAYIFCVISKETSIFQSYRKFDSAMVR